MPGIVIDAPLRTETAGVNPTSSVQGSIDINAPIGESVNAVRRNPREILEDASLTPEQRDAELWLASPRITPPSQQPFYNDGTAGRLLGAAASAPVELVGEVATGFTGEDFANWSGLSRLTNLSGSVRERGLLERGARGIGRVAGFVGLGGMLRRGATEVGVRAAPSVVRALTPAASDAGRVTLRSLGQRTAAGAAELAAAGELQRLFPGGQSATDLGAVVSDAAMGATLGAAGEVGRGATALARGLLGNTAAEVTGVAAAGAPLAAFRGVESSDADSFVGKLNPLSWDPTETAVGFIEGAGVHGLRVGFNALRRSRAQRSADLAEQQRVARQNAPMEEGKVNPPRPTREQSVAEAQADQRRFVAGETLEGPFSDTMRFEVLEQQPGTVGLRVRDLNTGQETTLAPSVVRELRSPGEQVARSAVAARRNIQPDAPPVPRTFLERGMRGAISAVDRTMPKMTGAIRAWWTRRSQDIIQPFTEFHADAEQIRRQAQAEAQTLRSTAAFEDAARTPGLSESVLLQAMENPRDPRLRDLANAQVDGLGDIMLRSVNEGVSTAATLNRIGALPDATLEAFGNTYFRQLYRRATEVQGLRDIRPEDIRPEDIPAGMTAEQLVARLQEHADGGGARLRLAEGFETGAGNVGVGGEGARRRFFQRFILSPSVTRALRRRNIVTNRQSFESLSQSGAAEGRVYVPRSLYLDGHLVLETGSPRNPRYYTPELRTHRILSETLSTVRRLGAQARLVERLRDLGEAIGVSPRDFDALPDAQRQQMERDGWRPVAIVSQGVGGFIERAQRGLLSLSGYRFRPDVADALEAITHAGVREQLMQTIDAAVGLWKQSKTTYNPASHGTQFIGEMLFNTLELLFPWQRPYRDAIRMVAREARGADQQGIEVDIMRAFNESGLRQSSFARGELADVMTPESEGMTPHGFLRHLATLPRRVWGLEDDVARLALFSREYQRYRVRDLSHEQARDRAIAIVDRSHANFQRMSLGQRQLARWLPFSGFETEATRILSGTVWRSAVATERALRGDPLRNRGMMRDWWESGGRTAAGMAIFAGMVPLWNAAVRRSLDITDEENDLIHRRLGQFNMLVPLGDEQNPTMGVIPVQNLYPFLNYFDFRSTVDPAEGTVRAIGSRLTSHPVVRIAGELASNREWFTGQEIRSPSGNYALQVGDYLVRQLAPSWIGFGLRPVNWIAGEGAQGRIPSALQGLSDSFGNERTLGREVLSTFTPLRIQEFTFDALEEKDQRDIARQFYALRDEQARVASQARAGRISISQATNEMQRIAKAAAELQQEARRRTH